MGWRAVLASFIRGALRRGLKGRRGHGAREEEKQTLCVSMRQRH